MSTKTTFKRVALVAVAAMSMGVLTSVAPASAAITVFGASATGASPASSITAPTTVGTSITTDLNIITTGNAATAVTVPLTWTLLNPNGTDVTSDVTFASTGLGTGITSSTFGAAGLDTVVIASGTAAATAKVGTATFTPKMGGRYTWRVAIAASTGEVVALTAIANTTTPFLYVTGAGAVVAASGIGTTTIGAITGGQAQVRFSTAAHASADIYNLTSSGVGSIQVVATGPLTTGTIVGIAGATDWTLGAKVTTSASTDVNDVLATVASAVAGTQTLTWTAISATTGAPTVVATQVITWGAAPVLTVANSTSIIDTSTSVTAFSAPAADLIVAVSGTVALTRVGVIQVIVKDSVLNLMAGKVLTAVVTGPGLVVGMAGNGANTFTNNTAGARVGTVTTDSLGAGYFAVFADGSGGVGTITISEGTTVISTETVTFSGIATQLKDNNVDAAGDSLNSVLIGVAATGGLRVGSYDVAGNVVSATPTGLVVTSDSTAIATATIVGGTGLITVTGIAVGKTNITVSVGALATATIKLVIPVTITKVTAKTVTMSFDKTSYAPGELMTLTVKGVDSNGSGVADGARVLFSDTATANVLLGTLPTGTVTLAGGVATYTYYAPFAAGDITVTAYEGAAVDAVIASTTAVPYTAKKITAATTVVNAGQDAATDAANEATDAANAATDAALAAADAADSATAAAEDASAAVAKLAKSVATALTALKKQITALTALVNKLLKK
jgi:hypothetical protein